MGDTKSRETFVYTGRPLFLGVGCSPRPQLPHSNQQTVLQGDDAKGERSSSFQIGSQNVVFFFFGRITEYPARECKTGSPPKSCWENGLREITRASGRGKICLLLLLFLFLVWFICLPLFAFPLRRKEPFVALDAARHLVLIRFEIASSAARHPIEANGSVDCWARMTACSLNAANRALNA